MTRTITAIEPQRKNPRRLNIYLDGEFAFPLAQIMAVWLRVGQELSDEKIVSLRRDDEGETAYQKALHYLSFRPRSTAEVRQNLTKRGIPEALVEATILRLDKAGILNDVAFGQAWVENRNEFRPRSRAFLRMELRRKGLDDEVIQSVLDEQVDEEDLARKAAGKYARRLEGLEWAEFRKKLSGFLARRGFSYATIAPVVSEIWQGMSQMADMGTSFEDEE
ncbi:MAG: RecX family transcriptional regulator [Chloroflexota bacterium]